MLKILLVEEDPVDAAWITELIKEKRPTIEVVHSTSLPDARSILAQRPNRHGVHQCPSRW